MQRAEALPDDGLLVPIMGMHAASSADEFRILKLAPTNRARSVSKSRLVYEVLRTSCFVPHGNSVACSRNYMPPATLRSRSGTIEFLPTPYTVNNHGDISSTGHTVIF